MQQSKDFHTFFVNVGKMHVRAHVMQTGYVPGQIVYLKCKIHNESSVSNPKTKFFLKQVSKKTLMVDFFQIDHVLYALFLSWLSFSRFGRYFYEDVIFSQHVIYKTTSVLDGKYRKFPDKTESSKVFSEMIAAGISKGMGQDYGVEIIIPHDLPPSSDPLVPTVLSIQYYIVVSNN